MRKLLILLFVFLLLLSALIVPNSDEVPDRPKQQSTSTIEDNILNNTKKPL